MLPRPSGTGPLLTEAALENATRGLRDAYQERMQRDTENLHHVSCLTTAELLTQAYIAGVRDGFVQGAEAQARTVDPARGVRAVKVCKCIDPGTVALVCPYWL